MFNFCSYFIICYVVVVGECRRIRFSVQIVCVCVCEQFVASSKIQVWVNAFFLVAFGVYAVVVVREREVNLVWPAHVIAFAKSDREYFYMFSILFLSVSFTRCVRKSSLFFYVQLRVSSQYLHRSGFCVSFIGRSSIHCNTNRLQEV